jgi:hypothetical protein
MNRKVKMKVRKNFFFEKKKQKTFVGFPPGDVATPRVKVAKVFCGARAPMTERESAKSESGPRRARFRRCEVPV